MEYIVEKTQKVKKVTGDEKSSIAKLYSSKSKYR